MNQEERGIRTNGAQAENTSEQEPAPEYADSVIR
jgi:hypothetical protein